MKVVVYGNSGSGKSSHARAQAAGHGLAPLDLDTIVWGTGKDRRAARATGGHAALEERAAAGTGRRTRATAAQRGQ